MHSRIPAPFWLFLVLSSCALSYYPGLYGAFLLDDYGSLAGLSRISDTNTFNQIVAYTLNGFAGPGGRPISLLSFAMQWEDWPDNPFAFKLVNLLLHLTNGILIYLLSRQLLALSLVVQRPVQWLSLTITALWLLHPLQVSTVLYVVQRMTELSTLFTLAGLLLYLQGRIHLATTSPRRSYFYMTMGLGVGLILGILSKENAILLCLYILVLEITILSDVTRPKYWKYWAAILLLLPLLLLTIYLLPRVIEFAFAPYPTRTFSSLERLVIQSHVLVDYLHNILLPRPNSFGLLHSDYHIELWSLTTILKSGFLLSLIFFAWRHRSRFALLSMGILWFFASHALESTVLNLELYFEHRNYLGLWGVIVALVASVSLLLENIQQHNTRRIRKALFVGAGMWGAFLCIININEIRLWANPALQAAVWAENHPRSHRALGNLAHTLTQQGKLNQAVESYRKSAAVLDHDINMLLNWQELQCVQPDIETPARDELLLRMATGNYANAVFTTLDEMIKLKGKGRCHAVDNELIAAMLKNLQFNPNFQTSGAQRNIQLFLSKHRYHLKAYEAAIAHLQEAFQLHGSPDILISIAEIEADRNNREGYVIAVAILDEYCIEHSTKCLLYEKEVASHIEQATRLVNTP